MASHIDTELNGRLSWQGRCFTVEVLHSRAGLAQQIWLEYDGSAVLVDCGDGCLRDLIYENRDPTSLRAILLTHGHFDHVGGLHSLLGFLRMIGRTDELKVIMPSKCIEPGAIIDSFYTAYKDTTPFKIDIIELEGGVIYDIGELKIETFRTIHCGSLTSGEILERIPSLAYRLSYKNEAVAITGDTGYIPALGQLVTGVDLALIEATMADSAAIDPATTERLHLTESLANKLGELAANYALIHKGRR